MEKFRDPDEPRVIDKEIITKLIYEQGPVEEAGRIAKEEGLLEEDVKNLRIEYLNVLRIDHLSNLKSLVKLQLCCNCIEKIENLDELVNLRELDLSFNNIEKLENMDKLVNLEIFAIFQNKLSEIENIENLKKLILLNAGNNQITEWNSIIYLKEFPKLRALNLAGNPCVEKQYFLEYVFAFLPNLVFYEYKLILPEQKEAAYNIYCIEVKKLEEELELLQIKKEEEVEEAKKRKTYKDAFADGFLNGEFFESLFENDPDGCAFRMLNDDTKGLYEDLKENMNQVCMEIFESAMKHHEIRCKEIEEFFHAINDAKENSNLETQKILESFIEKKTIIFFDTKTVAEEMAIEIGDVSKYMDRMDNLTSDFITLIEITTEQVMEAELTIKEQLDEVIIGFQRNLLDLVSVFIESTQACFSALRGFEWDFVEVLGNETSKYLNAIQLKADDPDFKIPEFLEQIMVDKETLNNALTSTREAHFLVIDTREDQLKKDVNTWAEELIEKVKSDEIDRNRRKLREFRHFFDLQSEEFEQLTSTDDTFSA